MEKRTGFALIFLFGHALLITNGLHLSGDVLNGGLLSLMKKMATLPDVYLNHNQITCGICKSGLSFFRFLIKIGEREKSILETASLMCTIMNLQTPAVCKGVVYSSGPDLIKIMKNVEMSNAEICYFILGDLCEVEVKHPSHLWNILLPSFPKPSLQPILLPKEDAPKLKVLHLTDTHYDPFYLVNSNADCPEPMCCRSTDGLENLSYTAAGKWGAYKCDLPKRTFEHALDFISETHNDIDYMIWTGDLVPHDLWGLTNDHLMQAIVESIELVTEKLSGVRVFPAIGNHERVPANCFPTVEQDNLMEAFYEDINKLWSRWLPASTAHTVRRGAFYSTLVRPGFRIISLNTNVCYKYNFWLLQNSTDPMSQLHWLINELQMAEATNEKVHIIGHIPPGSDDCLKIWSHNYYEIVARFENTITGQFFGHTHYDEIGLFYDPENFDRVTNIAYISPSLTPFEYVNPAFRLYDIDGDRNETTRMVVDYETWTMNLEEANLLDNPIWRKSYSARNAYAMKSLRPIDWNDCLTRMIKDDKLFDVYFKNYWRDSPFRPECSSDCKQIILCQAKSGRSRDKLNRCKNNYNEIEEIIPSSSDNCHLNLLLPWILNCYFISFFI